VEPVAQQAAVLEMAEPVAQQSAAVEIEVQAVALPGFAVAEKGLVREREKLRMPAS
jgi:hypothetical protein